MTNFYEKELKRMFESSEYISEDSVYAGKAVITKISDDLRAKVEFVTDRVANQYEGLRLSIINRNEGVVDSQTFKFYEIIGLKGSDRKPHIWDDNGKLSWFVYEPTLSEKEAIGEKVDSYIEMYVDEEMQYSGQGIGAM